MFRAGFPLIIRSSKTVYAASGTSQTCVLLQLAWLRRGKNNNKDRNKKKKMKIIIIIIIIIITARYERSVFVMIGKALDDQGIVVRIPSMVVPFSLLPNTKICPKIHSDSYKAGNGGEAAGHENNQLSLSGANVWSYIPFPHMLSWHCV
jgi:hypothetical protein